jgi:NAD(P)-dependent dehydrogenase (short-subunit alcohol dehydrogenase family)
MLNNLKNLPCRTPTNVLWICQFLLLVTLLLLLATPTAAATVVKMTPSSSLALSGKRVLVTGAGRGIGRAIAVICSQEGAKVAITSRTKSELEETASLVEQAAAVTCLDGPSNSSTTTTTAASTSSSSNSSSSSNVVSIHVADVTNPQQVESMVQAVVDQWGGVDILINNAGGQKGGKGTVDTLKSDDLLQVLQLNVVSVQTVTSAVVRLALPHGGGKIVNISSRAGKMGLPNMSFYVASKFALEGLTTTWAKELMERNIQVNSLSPGMVDTQSFPKNPNTPGVRTASSVRDGLLALLKFDDSEQGRTTGRYLHVDELDLARARGLPDYVAIKPIDEIPF